MGKRVIPGLTKALLAQYNRHNRSRDTQSRMTAIAVILVATSVTAFTFSPPSEAAWSDFFDKFKSKDSRIGNLLGKEPEDSSASSLTDSEIIGGLKEALSVGFERAVALLGKEGGFLNDDTVRIPTPRALQPVEKGLRAVRQDKYADQFIETMNRAAEKAVPRASNIFTDAIKNMSLEDARSILSGPDNAATNYFRESTADALFESFYPLVQEATNETGVTSSYKNLIKRAGSLGGLVNEGDLDLDKYVTDKALDGLFSKLALEEARIRRDPLARSSDLLKKVFKSFAK